MSETVSVTVRLPRVLVDRIEGNRTEVIRTALGHYLDGPPRRLASVSVTNRTPSGAQQSLREVHPDDAEVLSMLRERPRSSRDASDAMGWLGIRFDRAERRLLAAGLVRVEGGVLFAED